MSVAHPGVVPVFGPRFSPSHLLMAAGVSALLHALGVGAALRTWTPTARSSPPATLSVRWLAPTASPSPGELTRQQGRAKAPPRQTLATALHERERNSDETPRPVDRAARPARSTSTSAQAQTPASPSPTPSPPAAIPEPTPSEPLQVAVAPPEAPAPSSPPPTAELFGPVTSQSLGQGGWGRRRRQVQAEALAVQAQQPWALRASLQDRLAAMGQLMRTQQPDFECRIRVNTFTRQAQVACQPESLQSAAWSAMQGVASPGDANASAGNEHLLCLQWNAAQVLFGACAPEEALAASPPGP